MTIGESAALLQEFRRTFADPAFTKNRLKHDRAGVVVDCRPQRFGIVLRDECDVFQQRFETMAVLLLPSQRHRSESAPVIRALQGDKAALGIAPGAMTGQSRQFDRTL